MPRMSKAAQQQMLDDAGREWLELVKAEAAITARKAELAETFRAAYALGTKNLAGNAQVAIQRNVRRDDAAFSRDYPFESYPDFYKATIDTNTIKRELAPAVLEQYQVAGPNKVVVTALEGGDE